MELPGGNFDNPFSISNSNDSIIFNNNSQPQSQQSTNKFTGFNKLINSSNTTNINSGEQPRRYAILDIAWLLNDKLINPNLGNLQQNEAPICVLGFNASFGNARVEFRSIKNDSFHGTAIVQNNCPRITSFNIYTEEAKKILHNKNTNNELLLIERIITLQNWMPNETHITWNNDQVTFKTTDKTSNQTYWINLNKIQTDIFESLLNYMINGMAWSDILHHRQVNTIV